MKKIRLLKDYEGYMTTFKIGDIFEVDEPYQGFNEDGTFTIFQGMGIYHTINVGDFEVVEEN